MEDEDKYNKRKRSTSAGEKEKVIFTLKVNF